MITQSINLNLIPGAVPPRIKVSQYDYGSRTLQFTLYNGTTTFTQAGLSARIQGTKPDGKGFSYDATYGSGIVTADITRQMTACAGAVICELVIVDGSNNELGTGNFILDVEAAALSEDTDISETEIPAIIDAAEANAERAEDAADRAEAASANPPYIGENEHWYVWDSDNEQYVDSGVDAKGDDGATIVSVEKTSTSGYIDTYTITMSDGTTSTFTVTNGTSTLPGGGTKGQVLTKLSNTTGDAGWTNEPELTTESLINSTVGWTGKNQIVYPYVFSYDSLSGVTFTVMSDGTIKLNNTANASINKALHFRSGYSEGTTVDDYPVVLKAGSYIVSKGQDENVSIRINKTVSGSASNIVVLAANEESASFTISEDTQIGILLDIASGASFSDTIIHPMIRLSTITDPTYEPYHKSVEECLEEKIGWGDVSGDVQKNMLKNTATSTTKTGVTFTVNDDGSITISTASGGATANTTLYVNDNFSLPANKKIILNGCTGGADNKYFLQLNYTPSGGQTAMAAQSTNGDSAIHTTVSGARYTTFIHIRSGQTVNTTIYPMIRLVSIEDPAYTPYVPSNSELDKKYDALSYVSSGLTVNNGTLQTGGYCKIGNLVIVNIRVKATTSNSSVTISGLPTYSTKATANLIPCACSNFSDSTPAYASVLQNGNCSILSTDVVSDKVYVVSAVYLCD